MATDNKSKNRVEKLFSDIRRIAQDPPPNGRKPHAEEHLSATVRTKRLPIHFSHDMPGPELEVLRARIVELENQLHELNQHASTPASNETFPNLSAPILYEKEKVGFVYVDDTVLPIHLADRSISDMGKTIKAPILASGQSIGEMQVAEPPQRPLTSDDLSLANAIAQQASIQIQNLRLLESAERARTEAQEATRQFTHKNWESFLDAIHHNERIGYVYNQAAVESSLVPVPDQHDHLEAVQVLEEQVGRLFVKADTNRPLTKDDKALIQSIARQVGQQVENIRLLADAARARTEAEEATRRLTRQNWDDYAQRHEGSMGFVYDSVRVSPLGTEPFPREITFEQPLMVRGEPIGQIAVAGLSNVSQDARELAASIAIQASIHLEALRLTEELQKRARELQELDRLKSAFLANMSHELRTPLNSILGFSDVILEGLDGPLTENMDNDLRLIQKNGQHLLHLINDVLDMAKIESGRMNLHPEKFRLHDIFEEVTNITSTLASDRGTALIIEESSDWDLEIVADNTRLRQVMINLVNNAIKFTEKGTIRMSTKLLDDTRALITVKDTGIGIPPDKLESIFQEFTQVDSSTTRKAGGTGLGLPISRRLVELHGGRLWAESSGVDGEGTTFLVELPIEANITDSIEKRER